MFVSWLRERFRWPSETAGRMQIGELASTADKSYRRAPLVGPPEEYDKRAPFERGPAQLM